MNSSQDNVSEENDVVSGTFANGYLRYLALFFGLMGLVENLGITVLVLAKRKLRRRPHMFFVLCLSFSDTLFLCNVCMLSIVSFWSRTIPILACSLQITTLHISFSASLIQIFVICVERYKAIQETPTAFAIYNSRKNLIVFLIWVFSALYMTTLFFVMPWSEDVSVKNCRITVMYKEENEQRIYAFLSMLYIPVLICIAVVYGLTAFRIKRKINHTSAIYNVSQTPKCYAPKTEILPNAPHALHQSHNNENDENSGERSPGCEPVSIKAKQKLGNHITYQKKQSSIPNAENASSSFTSNILGTTITTARNTQRTDVTNAQNIQGKDVPTASLNIQKAEVSTAPNIQEAEVPTAPNIQGKDVLTAQNTQGKDVSTAPNIQGMDVSTAPNIQGMDVSTAPNIQGMDVSTAPTIHGMDVSTAPSIHGMDVSTAPTIHGMDVSTALTIQGMDVSTAPNIQEMDVSTAPTIHGMDVSTAPTIHGMDVSTAPNIHGMDLQTALNIQTTEISRTHEGRDYNDSSTIGGRGNDRIKKHSTNDVPSGSDNPSKELKVQRHGDGFVNKRGIRHMKRALITVSLVVVTHLICLAPLMIEWFVKVFTSTGPVTSVFTIALNFLNSIMNPYLYVWRFTDLRKELTPKCWW